MRWSRADCSFFGSAPMAWSTRMAMVPLSRNIILSIDLSAMLAGTKYRGEFEERVKAALAEARRMGNVILSRPLWSRR